MITGKQKPFLSDMPVLQVLGMVPKIPSRE
jgi:hypothetical protein